MGLLGLGKPNFMKSTVERYRDHLESALGRKAEIFRNKSIDKKLPNVFTLVFRDYPTTGHTTVFTFGLCFSELASSKRIKTELMLHVKSNNINWAHALGFMANHLRDKCPFHIGQTIQFGQQVAEDSTMSNFLVTEVDTPTAMEIPIPVNKKTGISLVQLFPIYECELPTIKRLGWKDFLTKVNKDRYDVKRNPTNTPIDSEEK